MDVFKFLMDYWYVVGVVVLGAAFFLVRHYAKGHSKEVALKYMQIAEKMVFDSADAEIAFVSQAAYAVLPLRVKMFVTKEMFSLMVVELYNAVKEYVKHDDAPKQADAKAESK